MKTICWDDSLSIGLELLDNQHKKWMEHFNAAVEAIEAKQSQAQISKTLGFLMDYTEMHFSTEEKYMAEIGYSGLQEHKIRHDELRSTLAGMVKEFEEEGATSRLADAIVSFLGNYLVQHIQEIDRTFALFAQRNKMV
jgi:hemerythrin